MARKSGQDSKISIDILQSIINGIDAYIYVSDPETDEILFINDKMAEHYGIRDNAVGKICWQVLQSGFTRRCGFCPNPKLAKNPGAVITWEEHSSLTGHYYRNTDRLIDWIGGKKAHLQHSVDITSIKEAQAALKKRLKQQELMADIARSFISMDDMSMLIRNALQMSGEFLNVSRIVLARLDQERGTLDYSHVWYNESQEVPRLDSVVFHSSDVSTVHDAFVNRRLSHIEQSDIRGKPEFAKLIALGITAFLVVPIYVDGKFWGQLSFDDCQGSHEWTGSDVQLLTMVGNVISGVITRNVTEEKLARMSSIVNSSPNSITYISQDGRFEYFNQGALDLVGYSAGEFAAGGLAMLMDEETYKLAMETLIPRVLSHGKVEAELPLIKKDGQRRIFSVSGFRTDFKGVGVGVIASDITEKRQLEEALVTAKEQAEQSNRAKSEFLSRMSHEMRTPMNAIIGMASIAKASRDPEKKQYCLDKISDASNHLLGVINDILDMSKIEANKFDLFFSEFNFEKMLIRVINVINFRVEEKGQNLIINIGKSVPHSIICDEQRLAQVIANLLSNAVKFTPEKGSITLSVKKTAEDDNGLCTLRIEVSDNGIGIPLEQQSKLFHSFEQADGGISRKYGGTGLGLAISKNIVNMMGGEIWVESEAGQGSRFIFTIKAQKGADIRKNSLNPDIDWKSLRFLVVDDAPEVREYFLHFAQSLGVFCRVAANGEEAIQIIAANMDAPFNIIFADWKMPGMDGIELTRRIKDSFGSSVIVIMISATEWSEIESEAREAGVDRFMPKPLFPSLIVDCINECLGLPKHEAIPQAAELADEGCFAGRRILLAEDIDINREILISLLQYTALTIDSAENGLEACRMFQQDPSAYDMIFMDIHMPEMDGYEATRRIRSMDSPLAGSIPIVAMTANVFREDIEKCLAAGMTDHVGKPLNMDDVIAKLKKYLPGCPEPGNI